MRLQGRIATNLVVVLILAVVMVGWVLANLLGSGLGEKPFTVTADFETTGGLFTDQEVTYRGVLVGKVGSLELQGDGVAIEMVIDPDWENKIPSNSIAKVQSKSAVGEQFVNLTPTSEQGPMLADGDIIPRSQTQLPVDFQELLGSLDRVLSDVPPEQSRRVITNLAEALNGRAEDIGTILASLGDLSDAFASTAPEQQRLLENATVAGEAFLETKDEFADALRAADEVFAGIGDEPEELR